MAQRALPTRTYTDAQHFPDGVNSYLDGQLIKNTQVRWAVNAVNKGGIWQTRPGFKTTIELSLLDTSGAFYAWWSTSGNPKLHPQFLTIFQPTNDTPYLVFGISGSVWQAKCNGNGTFQAAIQIKGLSFSPTVNQIAHATAVRSSTWTAQGTRKAQDPVKYLILQDGVSRAGFWTGPSSGTLNPQKFYTTDADGNTLYQIGYNQTRIGFWMAWSGNRLWVSNGSQVYASDLNDPLYFTEETVLTSIPVFNFDGQITGVVDRGTSGVQESLVFIFTGKSTWVIRSGVQNRIPFVTDGTKTSGWIDVPDFQRKVFSGVGCVAGKSIVNHRGILFWYSQDGIVNFDSTGTVYSTQSLPPMDTEMSYSKLRMADDRSSICAAGRDSYVFWSVPIGPVYDNGRVYNRHTQVLDRNIIPQQASGGGIEAWQGVWTGIAPVEWVTDQLYNRIRTFGLELSPDGAIRIWESFQGNRADNGQQIPWSIETKTHPVTGTPFEQSVMRHLACKLMQIYGNLSVEGFWKSTRGVYHQLLNTVVTATPGSLLTPTPKYSPFTGETSTKSFQKQVRRLISEDNRGVLEGCNSVEVESPYSDDVDSAFGLLFKFRGIGALLAYRIATDIQADNTEGMVLDPETGLHILPGTGCPEKIGGGLPDFFIAPDSDAEAFTPVNPAPIEEPYDAPV